MKTTTLLALAAGVGQTTATFGFFDAAPFNCPSNTDNRCEDRQKSPWDWSDLNPGFFDQYFDFDFKGWECRDRFDKRDVLGPRTFGGKSIVGTCGSNKPQNPSFGCGSNPKVDKFSIKHFDITVEFDCDLEFHYDMPGGGVCKHRAPCSRQGTTVKNTQCGGAKNVTVVYPPQPNKPKNECGVGIHTIEFDCDTHTTPPTGSRPPTAPPPAPPAAQDESSSSSTASTTSTTEENTSTSTTESTTSTTESTTSASTTSQAADSSSSATTTASTSTSLPPPPGAQERPPPTSSPSDSSSSTQSTSTSSSNADAITTSSTSSFITTTSSSSSSSSSAAVLVEPPAQPLPCPEVVPRCLNTWLFTVSCTGNTDVNCFCPSAVFVQNVFECIYSNGESDTIVSEAILYFQGICAPHVPENPAIVTCPETIRPVITPTSQAPVPANTKTVIVTVTTVVPCVTDGTTVSGSSTTNYVEQTIEVPEVGFATNPAGVVDIVATTPEAVVEQPLTTGINAPVVTGVPVPATPSVPAPATTSRRPVIAGANKVGAGLGLGLALAAIVAVL